VPENVSIAYRGANYAIGQGPQFYGLWHAAAPQGAPLEWWPLSPEGWTGAWARFATIEVPGTIAPAGVTAPPASTTSTLPETPLPAGTPAASVPAESPDAVANDPGVAPGVGEPIDAHHGQVVGRPVNPRRMARNSRIGAALLAVGVLLGVIGLFPAYYAGVSLAAQSAELVPHLIYLAAWALSAMLILFSGVRRQAGALIAAGVSAVTFGLFFADLGTPIAGGAKLLNAGLVLSLIGWLACAAGAVLACRASGLFVRSGPAGRQRGGPRLRLASHEIVPTVVMILAAIGAAVAFAPSWDRFVLLQAVTGISQTTTQGNAFANPAPVIAGDVAVMVLLVAVVAAAALWRPIRLGAALAAGAIIPMVAQAISAIVLLSQPTSPLVFGISQGQANSLGLKITNGLTPMFWVYCAFLGTLILLCVWMLLSLDSAADRSPFYPGFAHPGQPYPGQPYPGQPYPGQPYWSSMPIPSGTVPAEAAPPGAGGPATP
jgi:hypothetical protein